MDSIDIEFNLPKLSYYAGEAIEGTCEILIPSIQPALHVTYMELALHGVIGCGELDKGQGHNSGEQFWAPKEINRHRQEILSLKETIPIPQGIIHPGSHLKSPFSIQLPGKGHVLSSVEVPNGYVRYWLIAAFPELARDKNILPPIGFRPLHIYDLVDTNAPESVKNGPQISWNHHPSCCGGNSISVTAKFDRAVYVPGEVIRVKCHVESSYDVQLYPHIRIGRTMTFSKIGGERGKTETDHYNLKPPHGTHTAVVAQFYKGEVEIVGQLPTSIQEGHHHHHGNEASGKNFPTILHELFQLSTEATIGFGLHETEDPRPPPVTIILGTVPFHHASANGTITTEQQPTAVIDKNSEAVLHAAYGSHPVLPKFSHLADDMVKKYQQLFDKLSN